jgi:hypothetical protein
MLKGTMKVELTDIHTGEKQTVHEHNMVTGALEEIFKPLGLCNSPTQMYNAFAPYYEKLLGGILLFDSNIEENPNNVYPPASAELIGCGAYDLQNSSTGTLRGGYNVTESELNLNSRYMKYVYDFTTSQANGTIACVCLTHINGGLTSYGIGDSVFFSGYPLGIAISDNTMQYVDTDETGGNTGDKYTGYTIEKTELIFLIVREDDIVYYFRIDSDSQITIVKRRAYLQSVSVLENPYLQKALVEEIEVSDLKIFTSNVSYNYDPADDCLYIFSSDTSSVKAGASFSITKIKVGTWETTHYDMVNTANAQLGTNNIRFAFAHQGFVYLKSSASPFCVYKFEIGNAANVTAIKMTGMSSIPGTPQIGINGRIYYESYASYLYVLNGEKNEFLKPENIRISGLSGYQVCYTPVRNEPMLYYVSAGNHSTGSFIFLANYLATINNLSEPVTKTADKTMKITYIIQEQ